MKGNPLVLLICKIPLIISINWIVHEYITDFTWKWSNFANERSRAIQEKTRKFSKPWPVILISVRRNFIFLENGQWLRWFRSKVFLRRTFPAAFVRTSRYISRHRVHVSVIYVISEVFFGSIRLERRARTRVPTPGLWLNRAIGLMLNSSPASYAIRLCAHDKRLRAALPARESAFTKRARAREEERLFARPATRSARQLRPMAPRLAAGTLIPLPVYGRSALANFTQASYVYRVIRKVRGGI